MLKIVLKTLFIVIAGLLIRLSPEPIILSWFTFWALFAWLSFVFACCHTSFYLKINPEWQDNSGIRLGNISVAKSSVYIMSVALAYELVFHIAYNLWF